VNVSGTLYFAAKAGANSPTTLWKSNGTPTGTVQVTKSATDISNLTGFLGNVFFEGKTASRGYELWRSNGAASGTKTVSNFQASAPDLQELTSTGDRLYFSAKEAGSGRELWSTKGTSSSLVKDIRLGPTSSSPHDLVNVSGDLYFGAFRDGIGDELWHAKPSGSVTVNDLAANGYGDGLYSGDGSYPADLTNVNGTLFFTASTSRVTSWDLYEYVDGKAHTVTGNYNDENGDHGPTQLVNCNGRLFFAAPLGALGSDIYYFKDDPMIGAQVFPLKSATGPRAYGSGNPTQVSVANGGLYYSYDDTSNLSSGDNDLQGREPYQVIEDNSFNESPEFNGLTTEVTYTENGPPVSFATRYSQVSDADSVDFNGGQLLVRNYYNTQPGDRLEIVKTADVSLSGSSVLYHGQKIGTFSGGVASTPLVVRMNQHSDAFAAQAVLQAIRFSNVSNNPLSTTRNIGLGITDGDGGASEVEVVHVNVITKNDAPQLGGISGSIAYKQNGGPITIAPATTLYEPDSFNLGGGVLSVKVVSGAAAANRLLIGGSFKVSGNNVLLSGQVIATRNANGGMGTTSLQLTLKSNVTPSIAQKLLRSIQFRTVDGNSLAKRTIQFSLSDGDGGTSNRSSKTINVT
jgi:ELWxxDGT repeat protein